MKRILIIILVALLTSCGSTNYVSILADTNTEREIVKKIDLVYTKNLFFIDVYLNGKKGRLLVDTGANVSVLDVNQAKKYGFKYYNRNGTMIGIGGESNKYSINNAMVISESGKRIPIRFKGIDMKIVLNAMSNDGSKVIGVVGSDFLMNSYAVIDYGNRRLDLYSKF